MKTQITLQERLRDLRFERHLRLEDLSRKTGISTSALSSYENDDYKEINHGSLIKLARFYDVSVDYLLCLSENRNHPDAELSSLHLSDEMVALLKSGKINNRLLCEIATNEKFEKLMADAEIYVDGIATMRFTDLNSSLEEARAVILEEHPEAAGDRILRTLEAAQIDEEDFFCLPVAYKKIRSEFPILMTFTEEHFQDPEKVGKLWADEIARRIAIEVKGLRYLGTLFQKEEVYEI